MLPGKVHTYLLIALEAAPDLFDHLLRGLTQEEADRRPDPERFTIREVMAHLADWESVFTERMARTRSEDRPTLQGYDEGQWAVDHNYAHADPAAQARRFRERRRRMVALLRGLDPAEWERAGNHTELGPITLEAQAVLVAAHDTYHLHQIEAWRRAGRP
jgi:uncharacterized damage-inducible protein DinB